MAEVVENVICPMLNKKIDVAYCIELQMIAGNEIIPTEDEKEITKKMWKICLKCPKQECPTPDEIIEE